MRKYNLFGNLTLAAVTALTTGIAALAIAHAESRGTAEQQLACTPDVFRFCSGDIPDADRIVVCLRRNMQQLSNNCRGVFDASASMAPTDRAPAPTSQTRPNHAAPATGQSAVAPRSPAVAAPPAQDDDEE